MLNRARMLCFTLLVVDVTLMSGIKWSIGSMYLYRGYQMIYQIGVFISRVSRSIRSVYLYRRYQVIYQISVFISQVSSDLSNRCIYIAGIKWSIRLVYLYCRYQVIYQIGVFISRSSVSLVQIPQVFVFPLFQVCLRWFHCWIYLPNLKLISSKAAVILLIWLANLRHWRLPVLMVEQ